MNLCLSKRPFDINSSRELEECLIYAKICFHMIDGPSSRRDHLCKFLVMKISQVFFVRTVLVVSSLMTVGLSQDQFNSNHVCEHFVEMILYIFKKSFFRNRIFRENTKFAENLNHSIFLWYIVSSFLFLLYLLSY